MKITASLGNPFLIFIYSLAILLLGCAIGLHWKASPGLALCLSAPGALLMVIHDMAMGVLWFWITARMFAKARQSSSR
jgi:multisubunit Na+/H+ antiporter MnhB subunit